MHRIAAVIFFTSIMISCRTKQEAHKDVAQQPIVIASAEESLITGPCAVFYSADDARMDSLKKAIGEEDFYTAADDWVYYTAATKQFVDSMHLTVVNTRSRVLRFRLEDQSVMEFPVSNDDPAFMVYFFNGRTIPELVEITDELQPQYEQVFQ